MKLNRLLLLYSFCMFALNVSAQIADSIKHKNRLPPLLITAATGYSASMIALSELWYSEFDRSRFHFFNDSREWKQLDKAGHFYSAFQISSFGYAALNWAEVPHEKSLMYSTAASILILSSIEVFDGFSEAYGASVSDLVANVSGAALFYGQKKVWNEIRIHPKFSFHQTSYPSLRPEVLGKNLPEEILKDYNGQTYWLSTDISKFMKSSNFPRWLNIAVGYGAQDFIYAEDEPNHQAGFKSRRQFYLAIDFDFNEYVSKSAVLNSLIYILNMIHLPAPALEFSDNEFKFHLFY